MKHIKLYIQLLVVILLLIVGRGVANAVDVTYKVINKSGSVAVTTKVTGATSGTLLDLPNGFKSPLLKNSEYTFYSAWDESQAAGSQFNSNNIITTVPASNTTVYVDYPQLDEDELNTRLINLGLKGNKQPSFIVQNGYYLYQGEWKKDQKTFIKTAYYNKLSTPPSDDIYYWETDYTDPYAIIIQSVSLKENGQCYMVIGENLAALRFATAENQKTISSDQIGIWSFILVNGGSGTFRIMVGNDWWDKESEGKKGGYMVRESTTKPRFWQTNTSTYDNSIVPVSTVTPTFTMTTHIGKENLTATLSPQGVKSRISIPDQLKRKFCNYIFKCRYDENGNDQGEGNLTTITNYPVMQGSEGMAIDIVVEYTVDATAPIVGLTDTNGDGVIDVTEYPASFDFNTSYDEEKVKFFRVNDVPVRLTDDVTDDDTNQNPYQITSGAASGGDNLFFELIGDPYDVRLVSKFRRVDNPSSPTKYYYAGVPTSATDGTAVTFYEATNDNYVTWEMVDAPNYKNDEFSLRRYGTYGNTARYMGGNSPMQYQSISSKMSLFAATTTDVTYHIINLANNEAIKATVKQTQGQQLSYDNLPEIIRSPYIADETLTFYDTYTTPGSSPTNVIRYVPLSENSNIYVKYTNNHLTNKSVHLNGGRAYNMGMLYQSDQNLITGNLAAVYADGTAIKNEKCDVDLSNHIITGTNLTQTTRLWLLEGGDPYAVKIKNMNTGNYFKHTIDPSSAALTSTLSLDNSGSEFILMSSQQGIAVQKEGVDLGGEREIYTIQLMAALGNTCDASTKYYCIARERNQNMSKVTEMYSNGKKVLGKPELKIVLSSNFPDVHYHVIDKQNKIIIDKVTDSDELEVPSDIKSPLVTKWRFWSRDAFNVSGDTYTLKAVPPSGSQFNNLAEAVTNSIYDIYVTYNEGDAISSAVQLTSGLDPKVKDNDTHARNYNSGWGKMYLLQFTGGEEFNQEDALDWFEEDPTRAVYPYTCGDGAMYIYGEKDWTEQLSKGASTRTRWPWYLVSRYNDPYHVIVTSSQSTHTRKDGSENTISYYSYFRTYYETQAGKVITTNVTDDPLVDDTDDNEYGNASAVPTEYMVLGTPGTYKLMTTYPVGVDINGNGSYEDDGDSNERQVVQSFEQYWKTWETIMKKGKYADLASNTEIPDEIKDKLYSYNSWAYARPTLTTNDETAGGSKRYKYENHYFQTINMGEDFKLVEVSFSPVLVLLDNHGWEIMRRPLPKWDDDTRDSNSDGINDKEQKLNEIKRFDSPLVKTYHWFTQGTKLPGYHKYTPSEPGIKIYSKNASNKWVATKETYVHTSTSLGDLPYEHLTASQGYGNDGTSTSANDANKQDLYVTYEVEDEMSQTYRYDLGEDEYQEWLIYQGGTGYATATDAMTLGIVGTSDPISSNIDKGDKTGLTEEMSWYLKPNFFIDSEMGYKYKGTAGAPDDAKTKEEMDAEYLANTPSNCVYVFDSYNGQNGFDPYNIQLQNKKHKTYFTTNAVSVALDGNNDMTSTYSGDGNGEISLDELTEGGKFTASGQDQVTLRPTNTTFMAVSDANGNMRLMPRFDYKHVVDYESETMVIKDQRATADANDRTNPQTFDFIRPVVYNYHIIDNDGRESLSYKGRLGEHVPQTPSHLKSPFAKDFKYYSEAAKDENNIYTIEESTDEITSQYEITSSFGAAGIVSTEENDIYIRYAYNETADASSILKGKWLTMKLNNLDAKYDSGIKNVTKDSGNAWQWKLLKDPWSKPDPYAVQLFNRSNTGDDIDKPLSVSTTLPSAVSAQAEGTANTYQRFALLSHTSDGYALALAGTGNTSDYYFLQGVGTDGNAMSSSNAAAVRQETDFTSVAGTFTSTNSQILLTDDVTHTYTYKVITNGGVEAVSVTTSLQLAGNPELPSDAQSPLLETNQYRYYTQDLTSLSDPTDTVGKALKNLYGLYVDNVYVHYTDYDPSKNAYEVPNKKTVVDDKVARDPASNDVPFDISGNLVYNIIWEQDNMMASTNGTTINDAESQSLQTGSAYVWKFEGDDPYALKIKKATDKYVDGTSTLATEENAGKFMLLKKDGYNYGVLYKTGDKTKWLNGADGLFNTTSGDPTKFIIFALSSSGVICHLVIANIGQTVSIPYATKEGGTYTQQPDKVIEGSTLRDLINYPINDVNIGSYGLGDVLEIPAYRPNCLYTFYVEGIYDSYTDATNNTPSTSLNSEYKGLVLADKKMPSDDRLLEKTIKINVVYEFDTGMTETNVGNKFVTSIDQNLWYTFETTGGTPYLTHYTNAWGLQALEGRETRYTNDYLWTPVGDPFGFMMYNRYMGRNSNAATYVITTAGVPQDNSDIVMAEPPFAVFTTDDSDPTEYGSSSLSAKTVDDMKAQARFLTTSGYHYYHITGNDTYKKVNVSQVFDPYAKYTTTESDVSTYTGATNKRTAPNLAAMHADARVLAAAGDYYYNINNGESYKKVTIAAGDNYTNVSTSKGDTYRDYVYELLSEHNTGSFKVCPLSNENLFLDNTTADPSNESVRTVKLKTTTSTEWTYGLSEELFEPYYVRAGYVGGLTGEGKTEYEAADGDLMTIQSIVYNDNYIVQYSPGYYRLHNQPGVSGIETVRYVSGYLHETEKTAGAGDTAIPMHFYSEKGTTTTFGSLGNGFTSTVATRGDIPIPATEYDPSTIFYLSAKDANDKVTMSTQGLYMASNGGSGTAERAVMSSSSGQALKLYLMDIGGAVFLIHDNEAPATRKYLNFDQSLEVNSVEMIYDLKYYHDVPTDDAKLCLEPANNQGLLVETHNGGNDYYYASFCAPFDVRMTDEKASAYTCTSWSSSGANLSNKGSNIPAGSPVMICTSSTTGHVKMEIPSTTLSAYNGTNEFSGKYLEQKITSGSNVYTFGLPYSPTIISVGDDGSVTYTGTASQANTGVGFYINANPNKEDNQSKTLWSRNNWYVVHNKAYLRDGSSGSSAPAMSPEFVPVIFDDEEGSEELNPDGTREMIGDGCVYDLMGRKVATREQVEDGSWKQRVATGIYIINGKKIRR